jgi:hypothetical protein
MKSLSLTVGVGLMTRGFGGSGILCRKSLDPFATKLSDGCEIICAIKIDCEDTTLNVDIVAYLCNIVSPVFGAEDSGMKVDSVFASVKIWFWLLSENVV